MTWNYESNKPFLPVITFYFLEHFISASESSSNNNTKLRYMAFRNLTFTTSNLTFSMMRISLAHTKSLHKVFFLGGGGAQNISKIMKKKKVAFLHYICPCRYVAVIAETRLT